MIMTTERDRRIVGLIPAGGRATRIAPIPCSKELLPVGFARGGSPERSFPKVVSHYLLEKMLRAGARQACIILRRGKWDIPEYFGDGSMLGMHLAYLIMGAPHGPAFTLDQAHPFVAGATILFGFPDILFTPDDAFTRALKRLEATGADIVLGLFPSRRVDDVVRASRSGRVKHVVIKDARPRRTARDLTWAFAVRRPAFTEFLHAEIARRSRELARLGDGPVPDEPMGMVIEAAIRAGLHVDSARFDEHRCLDVGTPEGLAAAAGFPGVLTCT